MRSEQLAVKEKKAAVQSVVMVSVLRSHALRTVPELTCRCCCCQAKDALRSALEVRDSQSLENALKRSQTLIQPLGKVARPLSV